eukprot:358660-Chlamydomonas_euryale.AAC.3
MSMCMHVRVRPCRARSAAAARLEKLEGDNRVAQLSEQFKAFESAQVAQHTAGEQTNGRIDELLAQLNRLDNKVR